MNKETIIKGCENWVNNHKGENFLLTYSSVVELLAVLKEQEIVPVKEDKINKCKCGETICRYWHPKFCGFCGRQLLWY